MLSDRTFNWVRALILLSGLLQVAASPAYGGDLPSEADHEVIQLLIQRVEDLQVRVKELEAKLTAATAARTDVSSEPASAPGMATLPNVPPQERQSGPSTNSVGLRMFGDMGYGASDRKGETNTFRIGSLDLFLTGNLSDRVSILGEVLFIPLVNNHTEADVERLVLQYKYNDYFGLGVGRYHTSIGYYNTAFHRGAWFETAVDRPFMYAFDDNGGPLPLQEVGLTASGQIPSGNLGLNYVAEIGNGRVHLLGAEPAQNRQDNNNGKSFNVAVFARPTWAPGMQVGFSLYHDFLTFPDNDNQGELISTIHVVYTNSKYEFLNEGMLVRHVGTMSGARVFHTPGFYTLLSRKFGSYRPYFRYDYVNASKDDPIYGDPADGQVVGRRNGPSFGIRYDVNEHVGVKLQYDHVKLRDEKSSNALQTQFSFAF